MAWPAWPAAAAVRWTTCPTFCGRAAARSGRRRRGLLGLLPAWLIWLA
jgi:hypothetical protein